VSANYECNRHGNAVDHISVSQPLNGASATDKADRTGPKDAFMKRGGDGWMPVEEGLSAPSSGRGLRQRRNTLPPDKINPIVPGRGKGRRRIGAGGDDAEAEEPVRMTSEQTKACHAAIA
jgi:hypothetical protein